MLNWEGDPQPNEVSRLPFERRNRTTELHFMHIQVSGLEKGKGYAGERSLVLRDTIRRCRHHLQLRHQPPVRLCRQLRLGLSFLFFKMRRNGWPLHCPLVTLELWNCTILMDGDRVYTAAHTTGSKDSLSFTELLSKTTARKRTRHNQQGWSEGFLF